MNTDLAIAMINSRMRDMGYMPSDYSTSFKHCVLQGNERREIEAYNEFYFLEHDPEDVNIKSDFGFYDLSYQKVNELKYEHHGIIWLQNLSGIINHIRFIQVILKQKDNKQ
jgi:hypothetical protein